MYRSSLMKYTEYRTQHDYAVGLQSKISNVDKRVPHLLTTTYSVENTDYFPLGLTKALGTSTFPLPNAAT